MWLGVLGPVECVVGGKAVDVSGRLNRALLAALAVDRDWVTGIDELVDALWGDEPPAAADKVVRNRVSQLRGLLTPEFIETVGVGYRLGSSVGVDTDEFEDARRAGADRLALWRGVPFGEIAEWPPARAAAVRLGETRAHLEEVAVAEQLDAGIDASALVGGVESLVDAEPFRERRWALLMRTLYLAGRQHDALQAFQRARALLRDELGLSPGAELFDVERAILNQEPSLRPNRAADGAVQAPRSSDLRTSRVVGRRDHQELADPGDSGDGAAVLTFLVTGLVGSTALLSRAGEAEVERLRVRHFATIERELSRYGSVVKNLGDGLMVTFSSPVLALDAAVAAQRAVATDGTGLSMRVGLHAGEPTRDAGDHFDSTVVVAKRLCDRATGGQILASQLVQDLAGNRYVESCRPVGSLALKGLPAPVPAVEVRWGHPGEHEPTPSTGRRVGIPGLLRTSPSSPFVGRRVETATLTAAWDAAGAGMSRLVLIAGEPGMGKTRLVFELARAAIEQDGCVLAGHCTPEVLAPYQPFVQALRLAEPGLASLTDLAPHAGTDRLELFSAFSDRLGELAAQQPVLLVLEDLHWADEGSLLLLAHLAAERPERVLILGTVRDTEGAPPLRRMVADLGRRKLAEIVAPPGLNATEVAELTTAVLGRDPPQGIVDALLADTGGNPFLVEELAAEARDQPDSWRELVPEGVIGLVDERLQRLSAGAQSLLTVAAIGNGHIDVVVMAEAAGLEEDSAVDYLGEAIDARLVVEEQERARFVHALVREAIRSRAGATRRSRLHRRIAMAITRHRPHAAADLAYHWGESARARPEDRQLAATYNEAAGTRASEALAFEDAATYYSRAFEFAEDDASRCRLLIALGTAQRSSDRLPEARETFIRAADLARRDGRPEDLAAAALAIDETTLGPDPVAVGLLEDAAAALSSNSVLGATVIATLTLHLPDGSPRRMSLIPEVSALAERLGDARLRALSRWAQYWASWEEPPEFQLALVDDMLAAAEQAGDRHHVLAARGGRANALLGLGDVQRCAEEAITLRSLAEDWHLPIGTTFAHMIEVELQLLRGQLDAAESSIRQWPDTRWPPMWSITKVQFLLLQRERGNLSAYAAPAFPTDGFTLRWAFHALIAAETEGSPDLLPAILEHIPPVGDWARSGVVLAAAELCGVTGDRHAAAELWPLVSRYEGRYGEMCCYSMGSTSRQIGLVAVVLGKTDIAERHLERAISENEAIGARPWLARTQLDLARLIGSRKLAQEAKAAAEQMGMATLAKRAGVELATPAARTQPLHD